MESKKNLVILLIGTSIFLLFSSCKKNTDIVYNELAGQAWSIQTLGLVTGIDFSSNGTDVLGRNSNLTWPIGSYQLLKNNYTIQDEYNFDGYSINVHFDINEIGGNSYLLFKGYYEGRLYKLNSGQIAFFGKMYDWKDHTKFISDFWGQPQQNINHLFKINIDRKITGASCTQGYILVNGEAIAYSLELIDFNNQNYISSIPKGTYDAKIRTDGNKGWRIELIGVPRRDNVQIHVGNYTGEIEGCILIGTIVDLNNCSVTNNYRHEAMQKLQNKFNEFTRDLILNQGSTAPINIEVEITGI
jgi:hypothetical protein